MQPPFTADLSRSGRERQACKSTQMHMPADSSSFTEHTGLPVKHAHWSTAQMPASASVALCSRKCPLLKEMATECTLNKIGSK